MISKTLIIGKLIEITKRVSVFCILFGLSLLSGVYLEAQTPVYTTLTKKDGLPSNNVYRTMQDSKGFYWFATAGGVCRYNGRDMTCFTEEDGLPDNDVFNIFEDGIGRIWCVNVSDQLTYIQNDSVYTLKNAKDLTVYLSYEKDGNLCFTGRDSIYSVLKDGTLLSRSSSIGDSIVMLLFSSDSLRITINENNKVLAEERSGNDWNTKFKMNLANDFNLGKRSSAFANGILAILDYNNRVVNFINVFSEDHQVVELPYDEGDFGVAFLHYDRLQDNFQAYSSGKIFISGLKEKTEIIYIDSFYNSFNINTAFKDNKENLWLSTRKGVVCIPKYFSDYHFYKLSETSEVLKLTQYEGELIYIDEMGNIKSGLSGTKLSSNHNETLKEVYVFEVMDGNLYYAFNNFGLFHYSLNSEQIPKAEVSQNKWEDLETTETCWKGNIKDFSYHDKFLFLVDHRALYVSDKYELSNCYEAIENKGKNELLAHKMGGHYLPMIYRDSLVIFDYNEDVFSLSTKRSIATESPYLLDNIANECILLADKNSKQICNLDSCLVFDALDDQMLISTKTYGDTTFILSKEGLYKFYFTGIQEMKFEVKEVLKITDFFNTKSTTLNDFEIIEDQLFMSSTLGIYSFNLGSSYKSTNFPKLLTIHINGLETNEEEISFSHLENDILIDVGAVYIATNPELNYEYKLSGVHDQYYTTNDPKIRFSGLSSGSYQFDVRAIDELGNYSSYQSFRFVIQKPWWMNKALIFIYALIFFALMYGIIRYFIQRGQRRSLINQKYAELELSALQSQMNPHFVFNALNSIQNLVGKESLDEADNYISKFAFLMRQFLEGSKKKFVLLADEIKIVTSYLDMEKLRFQEDLEYSIDVNIDDHLLYSLVPANLIQPIVENAILHGLFHKNGKGSIEIQISETPSKMVVTIKDDGVGRKKANEIKKKRKLKHTSRGTQLIRDKIDLLNERWEFDLTMHTEDLNNENRSLGTKVTLSWNKSNRAYESTNR